VRAAASISLVLIVLAGCAARKPVPMTEADAAMFAPLSMRIHPIFTDAKDWNGDGQPDGVEALLEFQDQFNDPTKAAGKVIFELFSYRAYHADTRGDRVVNPWVVSLQTLDDQQARWNRTSRTYSFRLEYPGIREEQSYVLTASFDTGKTRFFDRMVLEGRNRPRELPPATRPSTRTTIGAAADAARP
jgi:hypothetical protein